MLSGLVLKHQLHIYYLAGNLEAIIGPLATAFLQLDSHQPIKQDTLQKTVFAIVVLAKTSILG